MMRLLIGIVASLLFIPYLQADTYGCTENSGRWCETDQSCAGEALCYLCELLGGGGNDLNPSDPFPSDQWCFGACTADSFSEGIDLDNPAFPACPKHYCIRRHAGSTTCVRRSELLGASDDTLNLPEIAPFQNITQCLASYLTTPTYCTRFGLYAVYHTTENLAQLYAQLKGGFALPYDDLSSYLAQVKFSSGLVGVTAATVSSTGVCALGSSGTLQSTLPSQSVDLWNSPWHLGSLTKSVTASLAALLIHDSGVSVDWTTTLGDVFPEAVATSYASVTLEDLVSNRGGFAENPPNWWIYPASGDPLISQRRQATLDALSSTPVVTPGVDYQYSNWGFMVAGHMLEDITGIVWEDLLNTYLFTPLGLTSAYYGCPDVPVSPSGHSYSGTLTPVEYSSTNWCDCIVSSSGCGCDNTPNLGPAGTMYMQLGDYIRYYQWHVAGELGTDTSGLLTQAEFQRLHSPVGADISPGTQYGHGWLITTRSWGGGSPVLTHAGSNTLWYAVVWMAPGADKIYFTATNSGDTEDGVDCAIVTDQIIGNMISEGYGTCTVSLSEVESRSTTSHSTCTNLY